MTEDKQKAIIEDFECMFGKRPDKRSKMELIRELNRLEREISQIRGIIMACECYESAWEGFMAGNERGKRA